MNDFNASLLFLLNQVQNNHITVDNGGETELVSSDTQTTVTSNLAGSGVTLSPQAAAILNGILNGELSGDYSVDGVGEGVPIDNEPVLELMNTPEGIKFTYVPGSEVTIQDVFEAANKAGGSNGGFESVGDLARAFKHLDANTGENGQVNFDALIDLPDDQPIAAWLEDAGVQLNSNGGPVELIFPGTQLPDITATPPSAPVAPPEEAPPTTSATDLPELVNSPVGVVYTLTSPAQDLSLRDIYEQTDGDRNDQTAFNNFIENFKRHSENDQSIPSSVLLNMPDDVSITQYLADNNIHVSPSNPVQLAFAGVHIEGVPTVADTTITPAEVPPTEESAPADNNMPELMNKDGNVVYTYTPGSEENITLQEIFERTGGDLNDTSALNNFVNEFKNLESNRGEVESSILFAMPDDVNIGDYLQSNGVHQRNVDGNTVNTMLTFPNRQIR